MAIIGVDVLMKKFGNGDFLVSGESNEVNVIKSVELPEYLKEFSFAVCESFIDGSNSDSLEAIGHTYEESLTYKVEKYISKEIPELKSQAPYLDSPILECVFSFILYGGGEENGELDLQPILKKILDEHGVKYDDERIDTLNSGILEIIQDKEYIKAIELELSYRNERIFSERDDWEGFCNIDAIVVFDSDEQKMKFVDVENQENKQEIMDRLAEYLEFASSLIGVFTETPDMFVSGNEELIFKKAITYHDSNNYDYDLSSLSFSDMNVSMMIGRLIKKGLGKTLSDVMGFFGGKQLLAGIESVEYPPQVLVTHNHFTHDASLYHETEVCESFNDEPWVKKYAQKFIDSTFGDADGRFSIELNAGGNTYSITNPLMSKELYLVPFCKRHKSSKHLCEGSIFGRMSEEDADNGIVARYIIGVEYYPKYNE
jgi:hypothetical protein|nr:MAG TPA: hypothetical protein [Bacteriophage sp.]